MSVLLGDAERHGQMLLADAVAQARSGALKEAPWAERISFCYRRQHRLSRFVRELTMRDGVAKMMPQRVNKIEEIVT